MSKLLKKIFIFYINPLAILLVFNLANIANFFFQVIASRNLTYFEFSLFFSTISIINILLGPFASIQLFIQQKLLLIKNKVDIFSFINFTTKIFLLFQIIFFIFFLIYLEDIKNKLEYQNTTYFILFFIYFFSSMFMILPGAILYSERKYKSVHLIILLIDFLRVLFMFLFISKFEDKLLLMIILNIVYTIFSILVMFCISKFNLFSSFKIFLKLDLFYKNIKSLILIFSKFLFYSACLPIITQIDIIFVKFLFSDHLSSSYIVVSTLAKTIYIIPGVLQAYIFNESYFKKKFNNFLNYFFIIFLSFFILIFLFFFIKYVILFFYGPGYIITLDAFKYIVFSFLLISFSNLIINFFLTRKDFVFLYFFYFIIILYVILNFLNNSSYLNISINLLICSSIFFLVIFYYYYLRYLKFKLSYIKKFLDKIFC